MEGVGTLLWRRIARMPSAELRELAGLCGAPAGALRTGGLERKTLEECQEDLCWALGQSPPAASAAASRLALRPPPPLPEVPADYAWETLRALGTAEANRLLSPIVGGPPVVECPALGYGPEACATEAYHRALRSERCDEALLAIIRAGRARRPKRPRSPE